MSTPAVLGLRSACAGASVDAPYTLSFVQVAIWGTFVFYWFSIWVYSGVPRVAYHMVVHRHVVCGLHLGLGYSGMSVAWANVTSSSDSK